MDIISRKDAKAQGLKHYFTGKPCKHGHVELRQTSSESCMECLRANAKKHAANNPKTEEQKAAKAAYDREYVAANRDKKRQQASAWKAANRDQISEYNRRQYRDPVAGGKIRARLQKYTDANREVCEERWRNNVRRRMETGQHQALIAKRRDNMRTCLTQAEAAKVAQFYRVAALMAKRYGVAFEVDHIIPVSRGGKHHPDNLQVLRWDLNRAKGAKMPEELAT
jgi:5-methylcytosine-specific restriction endonuclease McrA